MRRRRLLAAISATAIPGGCLNGDPSPVVGLGEITMVNVRDEPIEARFAVEKDDSVVYDETHFLEGTGDGPAGRVEIVEDWMERGAEYTVTVSLVDSDHSNSFSTSDATDFVGDWGDADCFSLSATPEPDGIYFAIGTLESCPGD